MNKIFNCSVVSKLHRKRESSCITLITKRSFLTIWFFGACFSISLGYSPH